ncbi:discoidin domain-containing protein [uncultured Bacteroides sp.]|jgi:hypothetical protein|uniref:discoidin domain-containing protein n=1 Tax=uncultured Bacteroides sp. TaxID=162156 RepID=UPI00280A6F96|nr:discoidin domain-containing protein [uncultured Bacteroides sp.]
MDRYRTIFIGFALASLLFFIAACSNSTKLNQALELAGKNRSELQKVLNHYMKSPIDSLKYRAACFLIENMDAHYSYQSDSWEQFQVELDTLYKNECDREKLTKAYNSIYSRYDLKDVRYLSDLKTVKADFLIRCIDFAFEKWKTSYAEHLNFDQFCEYLLPYRAGNEPLTTWQDIFNEQYIPNLFSSINKSKDSISPIEICEALRICKCAHLFTTPQDVPDYNTRLLTSMRLGTCKEYCLQSLLAARCIGVPVVIDFTPQWATRSLGHEWNALITKDGKPLSFGMNDECKLGEHVELIPDRIPPKVYRQTFAKQKESLAMICGKEEIPNSLKSPCIKDVTKDYYSTTDLLIKFHFKAPAHNQFAYLAVFNNRDWIPVCWAKIKDDRAVFRDLHKGVLYMPGYYYNKQFIPSSYPVIISDSGNILSIKPNLKKRQSLILKRKYQTSLVDGSCEEMVGGKFQAANNPAFIYAVDLFTIKTKPEASFQIVPIKSSRAYKYFRYLSPKHSIGDIAELEVYESNSKIKLSGKIIGTTPVLPEFCHANAFDGDPLTCFRIYGKVNNIWIGLEFDEPKRIAKVVYIPKNDDNCIRDGELYELFYWDNKWVSLGKQTGSSDTYRLIYKDVPTNALFLLRNLTKGTEERIFTYENGKQVWW